MLNNGGLIFSFINKVMDQLSAQKWRGLPRHFSHVYWFGYYTLKAKAQWSQRRHHLTFSSKGQVVKIKCERSLSFWSGNANNSYLVLVLCKELTVFFILIVDGKKEIPELNVKTTLCFSHTVTQIKYSVCSIIWPEKWRAEKKTSCSIRSANNLF